MSNPTKIYNDYVRANLPNTMTFNSSTARYNINNHSFFSFNRANWYFKYITKFGYASLSAYAVNNFEPDLVFDFKQNYYRTGGATSTFSSAMTHTASSNATMVDSDGLLKWRPHNLVAYSEDFTNSSWTKDNVSITANATTAPDGTLTADLITENSATGLHRVYNQITLVEGTRSCFFKYAGSTQWVSVVSGSNTASWVNIQTGVLGTIGSGTTTSVTDHGDGWYELSVYKDGASIYAIYNLANADGATSYTGDGTSGAYIWGAHAYRSGLGGMVNNPARGDSYVPTTSSAVYAPRVGHHIYNGSAWVNEGILHESEARTNTVTYSNDFTTSSWTKRHVSIASNVSGVTAPDGSETVDKMIPNSTSQEHRVWDEVSSTAVGETYSVYAKSAGYNYVWLGYYEGSVYGYAVVNLTNGVVTASNTANYSVEASTNGFYRISVTKTASGTNPRYISISPSPTASPTLNSNNVPSFVGDGTSGIYVYGAQVEAGAFPTSYIPTTGSSATRAMDLAEIPTSAFGYNNDKGSIAVEFDSNKTIGQGYGAFVLSDGTPANRVLLYVSNQYQYRGAVLISSVLEADVFAGSGGAPSGLVKFAVGFSDNNFAVSLNGATAVTDTSVTIPSGLSKLALGYAYPSLPSSNTINGHIKSIKYYPRRLTNTQLQELTT